MGKTVRSPLFSPVSGKLQIGVSWYDHSRVMKQKPHSVGVDSPMIRGSSDDWSSSKSATEKVWSCIGWEMNQLEQKRQKTRSNPSDCSEGMFQRQRFLRKQQPISGFALISLFSLPAACGRRLHLSHYREEPPEPLFYFIYTSKVDVRVFCEHIGLDLYCLLSHLDPNESLGIKIDQHREQYHDSGLCMTSRHTRRNAQGELVTFSNQELARLERTNRQQQGQTDTTMGDHANQEQLTAQLQQMQQQMLQMQQTIQAQQDAAEQAAFARQEQQAQTKEESDCSKKGNSSDAQKIDELTAKVDQLLKNNQGHVPYPIPPRHLMDPISEEQLIGFNKMVRRLPKELAFEDALQIRPLLQFFKHCRETQEEIKVLYTRALSTPALKVLPKVDDPGKFVFPCSIAGTTFKDALCDSEKLKVVPEKEHGDKGESRLFFDEDPNTDPTKFRGNSRVKQKVQKKRVKGDPTVTLIPLKCDENSIEYEVKCKGTSKPFSKVRAILTHELKEKGEAAVKGLLSRGWRTRMVAKSEPPVALRTIMYYLLLRHITISVFKKKKKNEINVMEKGKKEKKHGATGKVEQEVGTKSGVALDGRWTSWNKRGRKQCNLRSNPSDCSEGVFQRQRFLRKQQPISGFALISLFSLPAACGFDISSFSGEGSISLTIEKNPLNPYSILSTHVLFSLCLHQVNHLVPDSRFNLFIKSVIAKVDIRVFCEHIGLDLYCLLSHLDPNESLGIKIDQHREQYHDSGLFYLSDPSSRLALN
ncbi:hypothetical protein IGI04_035695 [Brassica rapa subsp. trilocularis]|uniref:Uncharacterized protein n=1 Tax=Brassica rapa subsp. trilocularis TaxID=1813537 RepID=A0ABQ7LCC3_BRACM|nr:hypothetical protein IGI04_035695 [Brassica rapa subsp. trilocularis]